MKKDIFLFRVSCIMFGISSFSILLSFFGNYEGNGIEVFFAVLTGILFWAGLILGLASFIMLNNNRKKYESKKTPSKYKKSHRVGATSFLSNRMAAIADIAMVVLFILFLVTMFIPSFSQNIALIVATFLLFSVYMHCMLNGVNYIYINSIKRGV